MDTDKEGGRDLEATREEYIEGVFVVTDTVGIVTEGSHGHANLLYHEPLRERNQRRVNENGAAERRREDEAQIRANVNEQQREEGGERGTSIE